MAARRRLVVLCQRGSVVPLPLTLRSLKFLAL